MTYGIISDIHAHSWSLFSTTNPNGINSRLQIILDEITRAADAVIAAGGHSLVVAGDIFHVRGSIDPEVLNPVQACFGKILWKGIDVFAIPGNHDLKSKETTELASAVQTLSETFSSEGSFRVYNAPGRFERPGQPEVFAFVPWRSTTAGLLEDLEKVATNSGKPSKLDVFIHAGIDGVLSGMPDHGLTAKILADFGFRRVFAGHYHNHKDLGDGVFSIGATTHQTWSDVGSKAGFLLVDDDGKVSYQASHAPSFVDVTGLDEGDMALAADGNYVRYRGDAMTTKQVSELRSFLLTSGARGVAIQAPKPTSATRAGTSPTGGQSLDQSVQGFVDTMKDVPAHLDRDAIKRGCAEVLQVTRSVSATA